MATRDKVKESGEETRGARQKVKQTAKVAKAEKKKEGKWLYLRMWVNHIASALQKDRGTIPPNISNRIMILNNVYITKYYLSSIIAVETMSLETPIVLVSRIKQALVERKSRAVLDVTFKNEPYEVDLKDAGLPSRISMWKITQQNEDATDLELETAARCLYTVEEVKRGEKLKKTRIFLTLRAKTGSELTAAENIAYEYLVSIGAKAVQISGTLEDTLKYITIMSDKKDGKVKDMKSIITSDKTLAQMLPNSGSFAGDKKYFLGVDMLNGTEFAINWDDITIARNVYVCAMSGVGKTVIALNAAATAIEQGMAFCGMDIKGNEIINLVKGTGGYIVSLRQDSSGYINSWKMNKNETTDEQAQSYFNKRLQFSIEQMIVLSGAQTNEERIAMEELLDAFHQSYYTHLGVSATNRNTWKQTERITPFRIYEALLDYMTPAIMSQYSNIAKLLTNNLRLTMSRQGSKAHIFKQEFDHMSIMEAPSLAFDFGILNGVFDNVDPVIFKLKFMYMRKLNAEYVTYKFNKGIKVFKILEEAQIAITDADIMKGYVEEFTLRRAQGQTTWLLGNSVNALLNDNLSKALIENTTGLLIGKLRPEARQVVIEKFGLSDFEELFNRMNTDPEMANSFIFFNDMEKRPAVPILKVQLRKGKKYKMFSPAKSDE